jgi:hypothetical protein
MLAARGQHPGYRRTLRDRRAVYDASWRADVDRLTREHGERPVREAMRMIEQQAREQRGNGWDREAHAREVRRGIEPCRGRAAGAGERISPRGIAAGIVALIVPNASKPWPLAC